MTVVKGQRPAFQTLEADDNIDERLEVQAAQKGIPTLMSPDTVSTTPPRAKPTEPSKAASRGGDPHVSTPRARMKTVNFEVPDYAWIELKTMVAREMVSVRYLLLSALRLKGITVREIDMVEDGRRLRGGGRNR